MPRAPLGASRPEHVPRQTTSKRRVMIPLDKLEVLVGQEDSSIFKERHTIHVALHPRYLGNLALGLIYHFNELTGVFHPKLNGILVGYGKLFLRSPEGAFLNEAAHIHVDVISDFWVFRPQPGAILRGVVVKKSPTHVGCFVHGCFNVSCYRPEDGGGGDWMGAGAQIDQAVKVSVLKTDFSQKIPFIMGSITEVEEADQSPPEKLVEELTAGEWERMAEEEEVAAPSPSKKKAKKRKRKGDETEEDESSTSAATPVGGSPKKKRKKKDKEEEDRMQASLLESVGEKFKKKSKKGKRPEAEQEVTVKVEPEPAESSSQDSTLSSGKKKKKKRKEKKSQEIVPDEESSEATAAELQNSLLSAAESRFSSAASSSAKKSSRKTKSAYSQEELQDLVRNSAMDEEEKYRPPPVNGEGDAAPAEAPKSPKKGRRKSKSTAAVVATEVRVKEEPPTPTKTTRKSKKGGQEKETSSMQDALIQNMLAKMPTPKGKKK